jgi:hypothetical protein
MKLYLKFLFDIKILQDQIWKIRKQIHLYLRKNTDGYLGKNHYYCNSIAPDSRIWVVNV